MAAESSADLENSERDHDAEFRQRERSRECEDHVIQKAGACTMSIPLDMSVVGHLSMADLLNLIVLWSIPVRRNDEFKVKADHMNVDTDARTHQSTFAFCHLPSSTLLP